MRHRMIKITVSFCLIAALVITAFNFKGAEIKAAPEGYRSGICNRRIRN